MQYCNRVLVILRLCCLIPANSIAPCAEARADHAIQEQQRPNEYTVAVEFKPRANCGGFNWLGSSVFGVSICITQASW